MKTLVFAAAIAAVLGTAATANARPLLGNAFAAAAAGAAAAASSSYMDCQEGPCPKNGPQLTGIALPTIKAKRSAVTAVTLPSGEIIELR